MPITSVNLGDQLSARTNPYVQQRQQVRRAAPQQAVQQQAQNQARQGMQQIPAPQRTANGRVLTSAQTLQNFDQRLDALAPHQIARNAQSVSVGTRILNFLQDRLQGKGTTTQEFYGMVGLSGAYAANTPGGIADLSFTGSSNPSAAVQEQLPGDQGFWVGGGVENPTAAGISGATLGGMASLTGLLGSAQQIHSARHQIKQGEKDQQVAQSLRADATTFTDFQVQMQYLANGKNAVPFVAVPQAPGAELEMQELAAPLLDPNHAANQTALAGALNTAGQQLAQLDILAGLPDIEAAPIQQLRQDLQQALQVLQPLNGDPPPAALDPAQLTPQQTQALQDLAAGLGCMATLSNDLAAAVDKLAEHQIREGGVQKTSGVIGLLGAINGVINTGLTGASVEFGTGVGQTAGNIIGSALIVTQLAGGVGAVAVGGYGAYQDYQGIKGHNQRLAKMDALLQPNGLNAPAAADADPAVQAANETGREKIRDVARLVKAENKQGRFHKYLSLAKNALTVVGGGLVAAGVLAGAAAVALTPVGWGFAGAALVGGIGLGVYKLVKKNNQASRTMALENRHHQAQAALQRQLLQQGPATALQQRADGLRPAQNQARQALQQQQGVTRQTQVDQQAAARGQLLAGQQNDRQILQQQQELDTQAQTGRHANEARQLRTEHKQALQAVSPEAQAPLQQQQAQALQALEVRQQNERDALVQAQQTAQAQLQQQQDLVLQQMDAGHQQALVELDAGHQEALQQLDTDHQAQTLQALTVERDQLLAGPNGLAPAIAQQQQAIDGAGQALQNLLSDPPVPAAKGQAVQALFQQQQQTAQALAQLQQDQAAMQQMPDGPDKIRERDRIDTEFQTLQHQQLEGLDDLAKALQRTYKHLGPQQVQQVRQQLQTVQQAQHQQHSLQIQALFLNGVDLRQNMDDLVGAIDQNIQGLETLNAEVAARLRQVSPKAAVETLVRALNGHEGPQARTDAQSLARSLLNLNPDGTEDAVLKGEPAIVAEVLRKNMGLAYL